MEIMVPASGARFDARSGIIYIKKEPIQVVGSHVALVKVLDVIDPIADEFHVMHWNAASQNFIGRQDIIKFRHQTNKGYAKRWNGIAISNFTNIHKVPLNHYGWYIFGERVESGVFEVRAVEPRGVTKMREPDKTFSTGCSGLVCHAPFIKDAEHFIRKQNFDNEKKKKGTVSLTLLKGAQETDWKVGTRGLLVHVFGAMKRHGAGIEGPFLPILGQFNAGHLSYGEYEVVKCPFTSQPRFDITYWQIYAHNALEIVSGHQKYHAYAGMHLIWNSYVTKLINPLKSQQIIINTTYNL